MKHSKTVVNSAIAGLLSLGLVAGASAHAADDAKGEKEKCAGVVKAGKNDCGTSKNSCAGTVKTDNDKEAWIFLPKGTCEKIVGATVVKK
jgi:uncharacterized membrane protein